MAGTATNSLANEAEIRNEMLFALSERSSGTVALIVTGNEQQRRDLQAFLQQHLPEYPEYRLDLTPHSYTSLHRALNELLPAEVLHDTDRRWLIHITGLENAMYQTIDGQLTYSSLVAQLNFERELLFKQPHLLLLWVSQHFYDTLRRQAPDLMHWLSHYFIFTADNATPEMAEAAVDKGSVQQKGNIAERQARIAELQALYEQLTLHHEDTGRLMKDKINLLVLLGKEYREAFDFTHAEEALLKAWHIGEKTGFTGKAENAFELGTTYLQFYKLDEALKFYQQCLTVETANSHENNIGAIYHQIGMVYAAQRNWPPALENYQQAIAWNTKTGNEYELGSTYHQIGMVYVEQRNWLKALENYQLAIEWKTKTGNEYQLGSTYHQIGRVYEEQRKWQPALENYQQAIEWDTKTSNQYALGNTYHQIGMVYAQQRNWSQALENYQQAIKGYAQTGNEYELGGTYHQLGRVYEEQGALVEAEKYFTMAVENLNKYQPHITAIAEASLRRVQSKLNPQLVYPKKPHWLKLKGKRRNK